MYRYAPIDRLSADRPRASPAASIVAAPATAAAASPPASAPRPAPESLSFVVDLDELGMEPFHQAREIQAASGCPIFAFAGPEYVHPRSGAREVAGWIL